jgi:hypothetical protein
MHHRRTQGTPTSALFKEIVADSRRSRSNQRRITTEMNPRAMNLATEIRCISFKLSGR